MASSIFQSLIDTLMDKMQIKGVYSSQDRLIFGFKSFEETCEKLNKVLQISPKYNLTVTPPKCSFHKISVNYLDFHTENHSISPISSNRRSLAQMIMRKKQHFECQ